MAYDTPDTIDDAPVTDWINDWDWLDDEWGRRAPEIFEEVRQQCPMAFTERYGRAWMPVTMDAVSQVAYDTENFSSIWVGVSRPDAPRRPAPPITSDPPDHHDHRRLLLPSFSPKKINQMEEDMRSYCQGLIAKLEGQSTADAATQYSQHIPVHGIASMIGVPESDADLFRDWIYRNFQIAPKNNEVRQQVADEMFAYWTELIELRQSEPLEDLATLVAHAEIDGEPVDHLLKVGYLNLLIIAGIDTTWSAIGSGLWHMATNHHDRDRLAAAPFDDVLWMQAMEEVLRYYAPVTMARKVIGDTEVGGCPVKHGDQMLLTFPAANHDPDSFETPEAFILDRKANRHVAFGLGIHRCLGSNLARLELTVAMQEWIKAFPQYDIDPAREVTWTNGQIRGPRNVPVLLNR